MYEYTITLLAKLANADFKEIELLFCLIIMLIFSCLYCLIPKKQDSADPFILRRTYGFLIGLYIHFKMLSVKEFVCFNTSLLLFFIITQLKFKSEKQKLLFSFLPFIFLTLVNIYVFFWIYGDYYGTHMLIITMTTIPKMMYYFWEYQSKLIIKRPKTDQIHFPYQIPVLCKFSTHLLAVDA